MSKLGTVITCARPVKKAFIIGADDLSLFKRIIGFVSQEVTGLSNLILLNDGTLSSDNTIELVNRHDPDVIINYTSRRSTDLKSIFKTPILEFKRNQMPQGLRTPLFIFDNPPVIFRYASNDKPFEVFDAPTNGDKLLKLTSLLNLGKASLETKKNLKMSMFKQAKISPVRSIKQLLKNISNHDKNYLYMAMALANIGEGSSVWHAENNPERLFKDKSTVILGNQDDLKSMCYFWNVRATYPNNNTIWFPVELLTDHKDFLKGFQYLCNFSSSPSIEEEFEHQTRIDNSQYYFGMYVSEWNTFEFYQNVLINDNSLRLQHPAERLFSAVGFNASFVLDVRGIDELFLPKSVALGELFVDLPDKQIFPHYFARISNGRLARYIDHFTPLEATPLILKISIPDTKTIFQTLFQERGCTIKDTTGTRMVSQVVDLAGSLDGLKLLTKREVFNLVYNLAPKSKEKLMRTIAGNLPDSSKMDLREIVERIVTPFVTINSNIIVDIEKISSIISLKKDQKKAIYPLIEELYQRKFLLRGKSFPCPHCASTLWLPLDVIREDNKCYGCNQEVKIPIFEGDRVLGDHFKLNELVANAVDQGLLPVLLVIYFLHKQGFYGSKFLSDQEIYTISDSAFCAEADLIFTLGRRLGLAEVKAERGFPKEQVERLLLVAQRVEADILLFSTLLPYDSEEVQTLIIQLTNNNLRVPAFILTREVLFLENPPSIERILRIDMHTGKFPTGPILLATWNDHHSR